MWLKNFSYEIKIILLLFYAMYKRKSYFPMKILFYIHKSYFIRKYFIYINRLMSRNAKELDRAYTASESQHRGVGIGGQCTQDEVDAYEE